MPDLNQERIAPQKTKRSRTWMRLDRILPLVATTERDSLTPSPGDPEERALDKYRGALAASLDLVRATRWSSVKDYGAVGDGVTDDTQAFQDALDDLTGTTFGSGKKPLIYIPQGQYRITATLTVRNPVTVAGEGVELNSVNVGGYDLNGSVLVSEIVDGSPVIHVVGRDGGSGATYIQGVEFRDFGIDGNGSEGTGFWLDCNSNLSDVYWSRLLVRRVGGSAFKGGDGTKDGSPRYGYSTFEELTAIYPGIDGFEFYCEQMATVKMKWSGLYVNGPGRHSFNFVNMGDFVADRWVENNAGQNQDGDGLHLQNVNNATFLDCYWEGDGRSQSSGGSYTPTNDAAAARLEGVSRCTFINCVFTSPSGDVANPLSSGVIELVSSAAANGFTARDTGQNVFQNCAVTGYTPGVNAPSGSAVGSGGSLSAGVYRYRVSVAYSGGWEIPLTVSGELVVTAVSSDTVNLSSIPLGSTLGGNTVTGRKIYRTAAGGSVFYLLATIADNVTTTYADTVSDATLTAGTAATFPYLVLADANAYCNEFRNIVVTAPPLISDSGVRNTFDRVFVAMLSPATNPLIGQGGFNSTLSAAFNGHRLFFGADSAGLYNGFGLTAATAKRASFLAPSYQSSRFAQSQHTVVEANVTSGGVTVALGGGHASDYAATEVAIYAASGTTTATGTKVISAAYNLVTFPVAASFSSTVALTGVATFSAAPVLNNNLWLQAKDSGGTARELIGKSSSDIVRIGSGSGAERINILPGNGGLYLGQPGVTASIYVPRLNTADAGNTTRNSQNLGFVGAYWTGSAESQVEGTMRLSVNSATSTGYSLNWRVGGSDRMVVNAAGQVALGDNGITADANSALTVNSTSRGLMLPRLTSTQRDAMSSPADGIIIFNSTTSKAQVRAGGVWVDLH